jgi:hypothetical protein
MVTIHIHQRARNLKDHLFTGDPFYLKALKVLIFFIGGGHVLHQTKERSCESIPPFPTWKMGGCL